MSRSEKSPPNSPAGDTIFALSSARGRAGVAVVRASGPEAGAAIAALTGASPPAPRAAALRAINDPATGEPIDRGLVLWFPAPASVTGEDVAEFHVHGSRAVLDSLLLALGALPGLAPAPAGGFTRRAFDNGKLDLTEVEGLADLIDAETEAQRRQALRQMDGALGALYEGWREDLVRSLAHVEAAIDFPDEAVPEDLIDLVRPDLDRLAAAIRAHLDDSHRGELLRDGLSVAIVGAPNAGKSSFLNAVARREVAIVSAAAGTTRDVIEVRVDLGGYPVLLADTAGLREVVDAEGCGDVAVDPVEAEGMRRALARAEQADLKIVVIDGTAGRARRGVGVGRRPVAGGRQQVRSAGIRRSRGIGGAVGNADFRCAGRRDRRRSDGSGRRCGRADGAVAGAGADPRASSRSPGPVCRGAGSGALGRCGGTPGGRRASGGAVAGGTGR